MAQAQTPAAHAAEMQVAAKAAAHLARPVITEAANLVLADWKQAYGTIRSKPKLATTLGRWVSSGPSWVMAEVGVDKRVRGAGGSIAHIIEFGSVNNSPHNDGGEALMRREPEFHAAMIGLAHSLFAGSRLTAGRATPGRFNPRRA